MAAFIRNIIRKPVAAMADRFSSRPDKKRVHQALSDLLTELRGKNEKKGRILTLEEGSHIIIFSDQHKGGKDGGDIFASNEENYLKALEFYHAQEFTYINLGDGEELWEYALDRIEKAHTPSFLKEKKFLDSSLFYKIFGNHDLYWDNDPRAPFSLKGIYGQDFPVFEGLIFEKAIKDKRLQIFMTHGHQGDLQSDGNWFSKWFVATVWAPLEIYLAINLNTPSVNDKLKTLHNEFMYEWASHQQNLILITGHTHQPVFQSLTQLERLYAERDKAASEGKDADLSLLNKKIESRVRKGDLVPDFKAYQPNYFNTGCCCFDDGDITGIEIEYDKIRLVKWRNGIEGKSERVILEEGVI